MIDPTPSASPDPLDPGTVYEPLPQELQTKSLLIDTARVQPIDGGGQLVTVGLKLWAKHLKLIGVASLILIAPLIVVEHLTMHTVYLDFTMAIGVGLLLALVEIFAGAFISAATIYAVVVSQRDARDVGLREAVTWAKFHWLRLGGFALLTGILILVGLVLLVAPGIYLSIIFFALYPVIVIEGPRRSDVLEYSIDLTKDRKWELFRAIIVLIAIYLLVGIAVGIIDYALPIPIVSSLTGWLSGLIEFLGPITATAFYLDVRRRRTGHCAVCGYDLFGNTTGQCPECGEPVPPSANDTQDSPTP